MKTRQIRTDQELINASWHIFYESEMLRYCGNLLTPYEQPTGMSFAVLMESFLIHARNLNGFFYGLEIARDAKSQPRPDDVIVEDFFDDNNLWNKPLGNRLSSEEIKRINKQLAHISYKRIISNRDDWDFVGIQTRLLRMVNEFVRVAPQAKLNQEWLTDVTGVIHWRY